MWPLGRVVERGFEKYAGERLESKLFITKGDREKKPSHLSTTKEWKVEMEKVAPADEDKINTTPVFY